MPAKPSFQFYPGDWMKDGRLAFCSAASRGIWMDLICLMFDTGEGEVSGTISFLTRGIHCTEEELRTAIMEFKQTGVADVNLTLGIDDPNAIITVTSRRLKRVEKERKQNADRQKRYYDRQKNKETHTPNGNLTRAYAEDEDEVEEEEEEEREEKRKEIVKRKGKNTANRFDEFWELYPRKRAKAKCREKWKARHLDDQADELIADVGKRLKHDERWTSGFVPDPLTYINGDRWEDELSDKTNGLANSSFKVTLQEPDYD